MKLKSNKERLGMLLESINDRIIDNKYTELKDKFNSLEKYRFINLYNISEKYSIDDIEDEIELDTTDHNNDKYFEWV